MDLYDEQLTHEVSRLYAGGSDISDISSSLGITKTSVCRRLRDRGIDLYTSCRVRGSVDGNVSLRKMVDFLGVSVSKIKRIVRDLGIREVYPGRRKYFYRREDVSKIEDAIEAEYTPVFKEGNPQDLAWLGGFFDGEGHVSLRVYDRGHGKNLLVDWEVCNTEKVLIDRTSSILDSLSIPHTRTYKCERARRKSVWMLKVSSVVGFAAACKVVAPHCAGIKRKKMEICFEWAMKHLSLLSQRGDKYGLACEYARKLEELK